MLVLLGRGGQAMLQVLKETAGQAQAAPRSHGLGHLVFAELIIVRAFFAGVGRFDKGFAHLLQKLIDKDPLHLGAEPGQVLVLLGRVLGVMLQKMERTQARGPQGA
jgi:hypothetical protein